MPIQIKDFAFVSHVVTDIPRARVFYEGFLSLKIELQSEVAPGKWYIEYNVGGVALAVTNVMPGGPASSVVLEVADVDVAYGGTKAAGVPISTEIMDFPTCRMFQVKDPDGNEVTLHQRKARP